MNYSSPAILLKNLALACTLLIFAGAAAVRGETVDFRYSPPEWQTLICLPDDPCKSMVDKSGALLYHFHKGGREFGTAVSIEVVSNAVWQKQGLLSPRVPIVCTDLAGDGLKIVEEAFAVTDLPHRAASVREDIVLVHLTNTSSETRTFAPKLIVDSALGCRLEDQRVVVNNHDRVACSLKMIGMTDGKRVQLENLTVPAGKSATFFVLYGGDANLPVSPSTVKQALAARRQAVKYWDKAPLPYGRVQVPDSGIQALVDSAIRNIWQARDIKKGIPVFQVGPTVYRGLWIVDGAFLLETAAMLGADDQARNAIAYTLSKQKPSGAFEVLSPQYYKENGIVLWTCVRHAMLTQDKAWLESNWPKLEYAARYIKELRKRSLEDVSPLDDGLNPPGEIDGGLSGGQFGFKQPEFSNVYWNLAGLHAFIQAAQWLGKTDSAALWQKEYDDFYATFRKAADRDIRQDGMGNSYLPIFMGNKGNELPQRGQWCFCHSVYPGQIFSSDDALVTGNLAMLKATEREGMVYGTGWDATGIWTYFGSFYAHAWLWQGDGAKALQVLYAFANHAAPVLDWREEQALKGEPYKKVGDMPHNWASAEFIRLTTHLLEIDRGDKLHLFEGMPSGWAKPGMVTRLNGIATPFGKLTLELKVAHDGKTARLRVEPLGASCRKIVVHLSGWAADRKSALMELDPTRRNRCTILLSANSATHGIAYSARREEKQLMQ